MSYMGLRFGTFFPKEMKQVSILNEFKAKIGIWKLENCPYPLFRPCLPQIGLII